MDTHPPSDEHRNNAKQSHRSSKEQWDHETGENASRFSHKLHTLEKLCSFPRNYLSKIITDHDYVKFNVYYLT